MLNLNAIFKSFYLSMSFSLHKTILTSCKLLICKVSKSCNMQNHKREQFKQNNDLWWHTCKFVFKLQLISHNAYSKSQTQNFVLLVDEIFFYDIEVFVLTIGNLKNV